MRNFMAVLAVIIMFILISNSCSHQNSSAPNTQATLAVMLTARASATAAAQATQTAVSALPPATQTVIAAQTLTAAVTVPPTQTLTATPTVICRTDTISCTGPNAWGGWWYSMNDLCNSGTSVVWPPAPATCGGSSTEFVMSSPGYGGAGDCAARMTGVVTTAYQYGFIGIGTSLNPNTGSGQVTDLSMATGISFYTEGDGGTYRILLPYTNSSGATLDNYDDYNYYFTAPSSWSQVIIPFTSFTQPSYTPLAYQVSRITVLQNVKGINFFTTTQPLASVNLWLDNLSIYGCP